MNWRCLVLLAGSAAFAWAADVDSSALLARVQSKVRDEATRIPRFMCRQEIDRQVFTTPKRNQKVCPELTDQGLSNTVAGLTLVSSDRARLDVMLGRASTELFSWPGGGSFDTSYPGDLLGGGLASRGDFAGFMIQVLGTSQATFQYVGPCAGTDCVRYSYNVPRNVSRYGVNVSSWGLEIVGFHGIVDVESKSANLLQLTVIPIDLPQIFPGTCDLRTKMTYTRAAATSGEFSIPKSSQVEFLYKNGHYSENRSSFEGCREYGSESVLSFGDDLPAGNGEAKVPPALAKAGAELRLRLVSKVDSDVNIAGDSLEASLVRAVPDSKGGIIPEGTVFRGHLAQLERIYWPHPEVLVVLRFDTIVLQGQTLAVKLFPTGQNDDRGRAVFRFPGKHAVLDSKFVSRWRALP